MTFNVILVLHQAEVAVLGYDTYLVHDACATTNRVGIDGTDYEPEQVHAMAIASLNREFCTAIDHQQTLSLIKDDLHTIERIQGNE